MVELTKSSETMELPGLWLIEIVLRRPGSQKSALGWEQAMIEFRSCRIENSFARLDKGGDAETSQMIR